MSRIKDYISKKLGRRDFLVMAGIGAVFVAVGPWFAKRLRLSSHTELQGLDNLDLTEWACLGAFANTILPKTDSSPSAVQSGVLNFLNNAFNKKLPVYNQASGYSIYIPHYKKLCERLNTVSQKKQSRSFDELTSQEQISLLEEFNKSTADVGYKIVGLPTIETISDDELFDLARRHIIQGYFAEPVHGANKQYSAWEAIKHICHINYPKQNDSCKGRSHHG